MRYFNRCYIMRFALSVFMLTVWSHTVHAQNVEEVLEFRNHSKLAVVFLRMPPNSTVCPNNPVNPLLINCPVQ